MNEDPRTEIVTILRREIGGERFSSQRNLARHLGVDSGTMSRILSGQRALTVEMAVAVISTLDVDQDIVRRILGIVLKDTLEKALARHRTLAHEVATRPLGERLGDDPAKTLDDIFFQAAQRAIKSLRGKSE